MPAYFDSSVLLSIVLNEARSARAASVWEDQESKVSSILLGAECWTSMRRHFLRVGTTPPSGWLEERTGFLLDFLSDVELKQVDKEVLSLLQKESALAECRTLDAIHLATALLFRERSDEDFFLVSFDEKMRRTAAKLKLEVLPAA
jgi:predicted nucleic acid-binding protein